MFNDKRAPTGDIHASATRTARAKRSRYRSCFVPTALLLALSCVAATAVSAKDISWHQHSESYDVYLGVVPATVADRDSILRQMHAVSPHGDVERTNALRHIMVSVFRRPGAERVSNVDISAEVIENDLIHMRREKKDLDIMMLPSGVTYCNFFTLHWNEMYEVKLRILEPGRGTEWVSFRQRETGLSD